MLFNSFEFLIFLPLVFAAYWLLARQLRVQNLLVGISFYTFQALSYTIDVYRRQIRPTADPIAFFAFPYFARDIAEFWRRWHMSLTTWFRDYLALDLPETCWYDANHLNRQGAETFTPRLAADLPTGR